MFAVPHIVSPSVHNVNMAREFDEIRTRLLGISEELTDLTISRLQDSIDAGGNELPVDERRLTKARRAVDKAAFLLQEPNRDEQW